MSNQLSKPSPAGGKCLLCLRMTDTGFGVRGSASFIILSLMHITGDPLEIVMRMLALYDFETWGNWDQDDSAKLLLVPNGEQNVIYRLCSKCALKKRPMPLRVSLLLPGHPVTTMVEDTTHSSS